MKKISFNVFCRIVFIAPVFFYSCNKENRWDCIKRTGKTATESRTLSPFTKIYVEDNLDVFIKQGNTQEIKIEAGNNLIPLIKTEVIDGVLHVDNNNRCNWARSYKKGTINVYITLPTLRNIWHYGSGLIKAEDTITCDTLEIWAHQSGDVEFKINANVMVSNTHTTADMTIEGKCNYLAIHHTGEGFLHFENLHAENAWSSSKASGDEYLNVQTELWTRIDWEGNIYYTGSPITYAHGTGTGKLIQQN